MRKHGGMKGINDHDRGVMFVLLYAIGTLVILSIIAECTAATPDYLRAEFEQGRRDERARIDAEDGFLKVRSAPTNGLFLPSWWEKCLKENKGLQHPKMKMEVKLFACHSWFRFGKNIRFFDGYRTAACLLYTSPSPRD